MRKNKVFLTIMLCITIFMQSGFGAWGAELDNGAVENVQENPLPEAGQAGELNPNGNTAPVEGAPAEGGAQENPDGAAMEMPVEAIPENPEGGTPESSGENTPENPEGVTPEAPVQTPPPLQQNVQELPEEGIPGLDEKIWNLRNIYRKRKVRSARLQSRIR